MFKENTKICFYPQKLANMNLEVGIILARYIITKPIYM